jgi:GH15 family glucan-1,4-alpha-glucosidase
MRPAYTGDGGQIPSERRLDLPGYPGGSDMVGNKVRDQFQLDAFGEALLLLSTADGRGLLDADGWTAIEQAAGAVAKRWEEPDAGVWELDADRWAHSRLMAATGLRAAAARPVAGAAGARWLALADTITAEVSRTSLHPSGRWQRSPSDERVDAALLVPALRGGIAPEDPRSLATLAAVCNELTEDGYVYRFAADQQPLGHAEGAFLLCGFWLSQALQLGGDPLGAGRWFERTRAACGPPGLYSEEFDVGERQLRGNVPQAFVHAELIRAAVLLSGGTPG